MYRFLSSLQLAIGLICAIAGISVGATLFDAPEIFSSWLFRILIAAFFINLLLCTIKLLPGLKKRLGEKPLDVFEKAEAFPESKLSWEEATALLNDRRFHLEKMEVAGKEVFLAKKNKWTLMAPHILHLGLLVIILGALATTFQVEGDMRMAAGDQMHLPEAVQARIGEGTLHLKDFATLYDDDGSVSNWVSTFDIEVPDKIKAENVTTEVNHPFKEKGISIYQKAWETRYLVTLKGIEKPGEYALPEGMMLPMGDVFVEVHAMAKDIALLMLYNDKGQLLDQLALKKGATVAIDDQVTMTFLKPLDYTVLHVKYNPWLPLVFLGFIIMSAASILFFFGRYTVVRGYRENEDAPLKLQISSKDANLKTTLEEDLGLRARSE